LGFGVTTTAIKNQNANQDQIDEVVLWMKRLNRAASELAQSHGIAAATDITGFSLLGHGWEMAESSGVGMNIYWDMVPFISPAKEFAKSFGFPGGAFDNRLYFGDHVKVPKSLAEEDLMLLFDPQTSGGLLLAVGCDQLDEFRVQAEKVSQPIWVIGEVVEGDQITIK
jgi:selenide,water dikinase